MALTYDTLERQAAVIAALELSADADERAGRGFTTRMDRPAADHKRRRAAELRAELESDGLDTRYAYRAPAGA